MCLLNINLFYFIDVPQLRNFFKEYDRSGEYLKAYGVKLGVVS